MHQHALSKKNNTTEELEHVFLLKNIGILLHLTYASQPLPIVTFHSHSHSMLQVGSQLDVVHRCPLLLLSCGFFLLPLSQHPRYLRA